MAWNLDACMNGCCQLHMYRVFQFLLNTITQLSLYKDTNLIECSLPQDRLNTCHLQALYCQTTTQTYQREVKYSVMHIPYNYIYIVQIIMLSLI